jgi:hypothetical protein
MRGVTIETTLSWQREEFIAGISGRLNESVPAGTACRTGLQKFVALRVCLFASKVGHGFRFGEVFLQEHFRGDEPACGCGTSKLAKFQGWHP